MGRIGRRRHCRASASLCEPRYVAGPPGPECEHCISICYLTVGFPARMAGLYTSGGIAGGTLVAVMLSARVKISRPHFPLWPAHSFGRQINGEDRDSDERQRKRCWFLWPEGQGIR